MNVLRTNLDLAGLGREIATLPFWIDGSGAEMAVKPGGGIPIDSPLVRAAIQEISAMRGLPALHVMVNKLPPGVVVPVHRDWLPPTRAQPRTPTLERWHLPIQTNDRAFWWDEDRGPLSMETGYWYGPVPYWRKHQVWNLGDEERVHLVVDLDSPVAIGDYRE